MTSVPPKIDTQRTCSTGAPGTGSAPPSLSLSPPKRAKLDSSTCTPSGTTMSEPPKIEITVMWTSGAVRVASRRSRSAPPKMFTTRRRSATRQRPARSLPPKMLSTKLVARRSGGPPNTAPVGAGRSAVSGTSSSRVVAA